MNYQLKTVITSMLAVCSVVLLLKTTSSEAQSSGCDYWINHSLEEIELRLEAARKEFLSIPEPTKRDIKNEYKILWDKFNEDGHDANYQMKNMPESRLKTNYYYRKYWKQTSFVPTEQEVWIFCSDTRQGHKKRECSGDMSFQTDGTAIDPPSRFRTFYQKSKQNVFEHFMLAAMIVDALPHCDESAEAKELEDKAFGYIKETTRRLWR